MRLSMYKFFFYYFSKLSKLEYNINTIIKILKELVYEKISDNHIKASKSD